MLTPIVVSQYTNALDHELIETHTFPDADAFQAWLDSQDVTVFLEFQPRDEVVGRSLDVCPGCGRRVPDFSPGGFESLDGQRGHFECMETVLWDRVHDRPADVYVPPEDTYVKVLGAQRGLTTCSYPEVEHPGFPCNHPPFDPYA
jgi:hypothetical protein